MNKLKFITMKKLLFLLPLFFVGCLTQNPVIKSPRYFNNAVDIVDYKADPCRNRMGFKSPTW